jgi:heat shock protein HtpX
MFWQIIAENKRKSVLLIILMGIFLAMLGYSAGILFDVYFYSAADEFVPHKSGTAGIIIAVIIWLILLITALFASDSIFLNAANAKQLTHNMYPQLFNVVEEMVIAAAMPKMPEIYITEDMAPNAFALGKGPDDGKICVTAGLLAICGRDELQGVVAHELAHIMNRDVLYMTIAATMLGAVSLISDTFLRSFRYLPSRRYSSGKSSRGKGQALIMLAAFAVMILGPVLSRIL